MIILVALNLIIMKTAAFLLFTFLFLSLTSGAQQRRTRYDEDERLIQRLSMEDQGFALLHKSKRQRTLGWINLVGGPALTVVGFSVLSKQDMTKDDPGIYIGAAFVGAGMSTTLLSIPLHIAASKNKKKGNLIIKENTTAFGDVKLKSLRYTSLGISIAL
jgi:hypothetical protein